MKMLSRKRAHGSFCVHYTYIAITEKNDVTRIPHATDEQLKLTWETLKRLLRKNGVEKANREE